jgi:pyridoxamine 5'-phosphate oxidase
LPEPVHAERPGRILGRCAPCDEGKEATFPVDLKLARLRQDYETQGLSLASLDPDPISQFSRWMDEAVEAGVSQANAMTLATADDRGRPSARAVLLKGYDTSGFVFYTNLESRKSREIDANPQAALCIVWVDLHRQVRIEGSVERVGERTADDYFASRPREAQIAAAASPQSRVVRDRVALEDLVDQRTVEYGEATIPRPPHWGGYKVCPERIEFWQGRRHRLHDRIVYRADGGSWRRERLAP